MATARSSKRSTASEAALRRYEETMGHTGHRLTPQRRTVYDALLTRRDHPTATEVFLRVKEEMPTISLATVYNCLETLVECELVKQVNVDREPTRYCPNQEAHGHFVCAKCGHVFDIPLSPKKLQSAFNLPRGYDVTTQEVTLRGECSACSSQK